MNFDAIINLENVSPLHECKIDEIEVVKSSEEIRYPYLLYLPPGVETQACNLMCWATGSFDSPDIDRQIKSSRVPSYIQSYCKGNAIAFFVPILPRTRIAGINYDAQILSRSTMIPTYDCPDYYKRPDIEIIKMIDQIRKTFATNNWNIADKVIFAGVSAGGSLVNRFAILYPEMVSALAIMLAGGSYPLDDIKGITLGYPFGTYDLQLISGHQFSLQKFLRIRQFVYAGSLDTNDLHNPLAHNLNEDPELISALRPILGADQLQMAKNYVNRLIELGADVTFLEIGDLGHSADVRVFKKLVEFLDSIFGF